MQTQQNLTILQHIHHHNQQEADAPNYDFSECTKIKKLTSHDIYRFRHQNVPLVVKLFAPQAAKNYEQEVSLLERMNHKQILRIMFKRGALNSSSCEPLERCNLIVLKQATRGDLNDYLPRFGRMTQKMARTLFLQLLEGLMVASKLKPAIIHPNLQAASILLGQSGQLYICGWSQITAKQEPILLQECIFACGEILICLLTSFMPFYKKYSVTDEFYKLITQEHIHKFWEQLLKSMGRVDKKFKFSAQFKTLIEKIFLKKIKTFEEIFNEEWVKGQVYNSEELAIALEQNQKLKNQKSEAKKKLELANQQKRRKALRDFELSYGLQRSSQTEHQQFINDCQMNTIKEDDLPNGKSNVKVQAPPAFVIASLLELLRQQDGKSAQMVAWQFVLNSHKIVKAINSFFVDLLFSVSLLEDDQQDQIDPTVPSDSVSMRLKLSFLRSQKQIYAQVESVQSNFNDYYTNLVLGFFEEKMGTKEGAAMNSKQN